MMVVMDDERGIVSSCLVAHLIGMLASRSPFVAASKSGPSGIFVYRSARRYRRKTKCYARETCRFGNHTSIRLKTSALAFHQN